MLEPWLFAMFSGVAVGCALGVVFHRNPVHCALLLVGVLLSLAGVFILLHAQFVAALQVIVYAGAIMVLFLFVVMLLNVPTEDPPTGYHARLLGGAGPRRIGAVLSFVLIVELAWALRQLQGAPMPTGDAATPPTVRDIGYRLFHDYGFAFEATSVLILVAMVGAIVLARKEKG